MARGLAGLAAASEGWRRLKPEGGPETAAAIRAALGTATPDARFAPALAEYERARAGELAAADGSAAATVPPGLRTFLHANDERVTCLVRHRSDLARWAASRGQPPEGVDAEAAARQARAMEEAFRTRYGASARCAAVA